MAALRSWQQKPKNGHMGVSLSVVVINTICLGPKCAELNCQKRVVPEQLHGMTFTPPKTKVTSFVQGHKDFAQLQL